jgi:hypothetical protein
LRGEDKVMDKGDPSWTSLNDALVATNFILEKI